MRQVVALLVLSSLAVCARADDWPAWRGPTGQGVCLEKNLLTKWSKNENIKWKVPLSESGNSTPVVWKDKIFLTQANKGGTVRSLICFNRGNGKQLWKNDVAYPDKERNWAPTWYANASPAVDGERVTVSFGSAGMYCYDLAGKERWKRTDLGKWEHKFGNAASPVLYGELCILWCGPNETKGRNFLLAVNKKTGKTVWEHDEKHGSWSTPLIVKVSGQDQLLLGTGPEARGIPDPPNNFLKGIDPKTGKDLWLCRGLNNYVYASPLYANGVAVQMCGFNGSALAVKVGGSGDITKDRLWLHPKNIQRVGSGAIVGDHVYIVEENGLPHCHELATGKEVWQVEKRPAGAKTWGSMVHADGKLWVLMFDGRTVIFNASPKYEVIAINSLDDRETTNSSLAISNGEIFIRTNRQLWCVSAKK